MLTDQEAAEFAACDYDELDPLIRETVRLLRDAGFRTHTSCQGTDGHGFHFATVGMIPDEGKSAQETGERLARLLLSLDTQGFSIKCERSYPSTNVADANEWIVLEFWSLDCLPHPPIPLKKFSIQSQP